MNCIHGIGMEDTCSKCIDIKIEEDKHKKLKPTSEEIISLLKNMIQLNGTLLELMSELMHKVRNIEHAIKEGLIKESSKSEHQDGDGSRQTAKAGGSDSSVNSRQESEASGEEEKEIVYEFLVNTNDNGTHIIKAINEHDLAFKLGKQGYGPGSYIVTAKAKWENE